VRVVVTGGAGFIGSHYVRTLLGGGYPAFAGADVVVLDALTYAGTRTNLAAVAQHPRLTVVVGDVCDSSRVDEVVTDADVVLHFAAESHVDRSISGAAAFVLTNVLGTQTVLDAALRRGVGRVVAVSTDEVYGSIATGSWDEDEPLAPNSPYAASKAAADLMARAYHRTHGLDVCVTRGCNTYGPHQLPEKVIPLFVTNLLDGLPVPLYGDGLNVREWLHVDDHCAAIQAVAQRGRPGAVYNIGGGTELTNAQLTDRLLTLTGRGPELVQRVADRLGHDRRYSLDWTRAADELGYAPRVGLDEGLAATVAWYRDHRSWWEPLRDRARLAP
jgi:dTDP-glucose 4,6-dehydratase